MLPRSWRRFWLSKSNSSTRVPSRTTTRVSSAWAASISIFLVIKLVSAARDGPKVQAPAQVRRAAGPRPPAGIGCGGSRGADDEGAAYQVSLFQQRARLLDEAGASARGASSPSGVDPTRGR